MHTVCAAFLEVVFEEISQVRADLSALNGHLLYEAVVPPRTGLGHLTRFGCSFTIRTVLMIAQWSVARIFLRNPQ